MYMIKLKCENITPLFMSGADTREFELRAQSVIGMMRFWWRAMRCIEDTERLSEEETRLFGGRVGDEPYRRAFDIRISEDFTEKNIEKAFREHRPSIKYLFYSMTLAEKDYPHRKYSYLVTGSGFSITLKSYRKKECVRAAASLWAAIHLGGFGSRSRRGAGNLTVTGVEDRQKILGETGLDFIPEGNNAEETLAWIVKNLRIARGLITREETSFTSTYSNLSISRVVLSREAYDDWKGALNGIGEPFKTFRDKNRAEIFDAGAFGLPVRHRNSGTTMNPYIANNKKERRASPLVFKVIRSNGKYYGYVLRLAGEFLPEGGSIRSKQDSQKQDPDYRLVDEFWNLLRKKELEGTLLMPGTIERLREKIVEQCNPKRIILFGSRARGDFHTKSDADIAVETDKNNLESTEASGALDIVDLNRVGKEFRSKIETEGMVIYERQG